MDYGTYERDGVVYTITYTTDKEGTWISYACSECGRTVGNTTGNGNKAHDYAVAVSGIGMHHGKTHKAE